MLTVEK